MEDHSNLFDSFSCPSSEFSSLIIIKAKAHQYARLATTLQLHDLRHINDDRGRHFIDQSPELGFGHRSLDQRRRAQRTGIIRHSWNYETEMLQRRKSGLQNVKDVQDPKTQSGDVIWSDNRSC
ncbi:hypothetical protein E4U15_006479 [Claviceps sp. LM218 group G6]|nr:hypothetical protein E4U15_006479 [Claviceps sp. LM218 group G6]